MLFENLKAMKQQKKQSKKEQTEREEAIKEKLKESQKYLVALESIREESVRQYFLSEENFVSAWIKILGILYMKI